MRLENMNGVRPQKDLVVVNVQPRETTGLYLGGEEQATKERVEMYYGVVEALGPLATEVKHCPNLNINDIAIFSQFAGSYIATNDDKLHKIIRGYDIMATTTNLESIDELTVTPTADRLLIVVLKQDVTAEGLFLTEEDSRDPRLSDIKYGVVIKLGPSTNGGVEVHDTIAFDLHVGETIRYGTSDDTPELKVIREDDILFIKK